MEAKGRRPENPCKRYVKVRADFELDGRIRPLLFRDCLLYTSILDRLIQQCVLQVMEPICEAKFCDTSNGFRPNRGVENALAQAEKHMQRDHLHIVIDIDIKSFFDNVHHGKLLRQIWAMGIHDKELLSIISAMLKACLLYTSRCV